MTMRFFDLPTEIRLQIYSALLVHSQPIVLIADYNNPSSLRCIGKYGLCPALLQLNKQAYSEASPLLYSNNRFQSRDIFNSTDSASIAPFLLQVRSQANLIRHIRVPFPNFNVDFRHNSASLHKVHIKNLELIRDTCTSITTLEFSVHSDSMNNALHDSPVAEQALDLLDARLKDIQSLREIIVSFQVYSDEEFSDDKMKMRDRGWTIEIRILPPKKWISEDDRVEFDNEEDCNAYDEECRRREWQREQEQEDEWWEEEYYRRRLDPYRKNDSDYD